MTHRDNRKRRLRNSKTDRMSLQKKALAAGLAILALIAVSATLLHAETSGGRLSADASTVISGSKIQLKLEGIHFPSYMKWSSSNERVATVVDGLVTAKSKGKCSITASYGFRTYSCTLEVETPKLSQSALRLGIEKKKKLELEGTSKTVTWKSSDSSVAKVAADGTVTGIAAGHASLTATVDGKKYTCKVKVYDELKGKTIIGIGDSLMYGNILGNRYTWLNLLGKAHNMKTYNYGQNGNPVAQPAGSSGIVSMSERYKEIIKAVPDTDYIVVLGGANDKRLNIPIGKNSDKTNKTFKGALNILLDGLHKAYPDAVLLCMTNYNRFPTPDSIGNTDLDYVNAMIEVCKLKGVVCFDNYHDSGINFQDSDCLSWCDEGVYLGIGKNGHFSPKAYKYLLPLYETFLQKNS